MSGSWLFSCIPKYRQSQAHMWFHESVYRHAGLGYMNYSVILNREGCKSIFSQTGHSRTLKAVFLSLPFFGGFDD